MLRKSAKCLNSPGAPQPLPPRKLPTLNSKLETRNSKLPPRLPLHPPPPQVGQTQTQPGPARPPATPKPSTSSIFRIWLQPASTSCRAGPRRAAIAKAKRLPPFREQAKRLPPFQGKPPPHLPLNPIPCQKPTTRPPSLTPVFFPGLPSPVPGPSPDPGPPSPVSCPVLPRPRPPQPSPPRKKPSSFPNSTPTPGPRQTPQPLHPPG